MDHRNRRRHSRVDFETAIDLHFPGRRFERCRSRDLGLRGVFVLGAEAALDEKCEVVLHLTGASSALTLHMKGQVVRVEPEGIALRFAEIDLDSFTHLKNIIYYNTEDPDVLDQEWRDAAPGNQPGE